MLDMICSFLLTSELNRADFGYGPIIQIKVNGRWWTCFKYIQIKTCGLSRVPQGNVLAPLLFILYYVDMWNDFENEIILYADEVEVEVVLKLNET